MGFHSPKPTAIAKLIPAPKQGFDYPLTEAMKMEPRLGEMMKNDPRIKTLMDHALRLKDWCAMPRPMLPAWCLSNLPLVDHLPLFVDKEGGIVTQYEMSCVEKIGLVKFDFLGLKTLTLIHDCLKLIEITRGEKMDLDHLPLDDKKTYRTLCQRQHHRRVPTGKHGHPRDDRQDQAQLLRGSGRDLSAVSARSPR